jgi:AraC family transcriptional activator of mtrCDE
MKKLSDINPLLRMSGFYHFCGAHREQQRIGYCYAFHLFTAGRGYIMHNQDKFEVSNGTFVFIKPDITHSFHIIEEPLQSYNIYCDLWLDEQPNLLFPQCAFYQETYRKELLTLQQYCPELDSLPTHSSLQHYPQLIMLMGQIDKMFNHIQFYRSESVNSLFYSWLLQWYNAVRYAHPTDRRIISMVQEMEQHPEFHHDNKEWCEKLGLQRSYFHALFKKETGLTPNQYLIQIRMKKSALLLQGNNRSITSISEELGYASVHYFTRQFTNYFGVSPSRYRRDWTSI